MKLNPGLRFIVRSPSSVQIGAGPDRLIVDGLCREDRLLIDALRIGIPDGREIPEAARCSVAVPRASDLLDALKPVMIACSRETEWTSGLRSDRLGPDNLQWSAAYGTDGVRIIERRSRTVVQLIGLGRTGALLGEALGSAGVGTLILSDPLRVSAADVGPGSYRLADVGLMRTEALRRKISHLDPTIAVHRASAPPPGSTVARRPLPVRTDLLIYCGQDSPGPNDLSALMGGGRGYLVVLSGEGMASVGPLVSPGLTACLECVDRHRLDEENQYDPERTGNPMDTGNTGTPEFVGGPHRDIVPATGEETALAVASAGLAALQALLFIDGVYRPQAWSAVLDVNAANGGVTRREVRAHPECSCQLQNSAA